MNTYPRSPYAHIGSSLTPGATAKPFDITTGIRARGIIFGILTLLRYGSSVIVRIFDGIAEQRDRQAKEIVAYYGQHRGSDSLKRDVQDRNLFETTSEAAAGPPIPRRDAACHSL